MKVLAASLFVWICIAVKVMAQNAALQTALPEVMPSHATGQATDNRESFQTLPGYKVERLFSVPREEMGSWVSLTLDDQGRLLASDEGDKGIFRIIPAPLDGSRPTQVERLKVDISGAQGMLHAFSSLYLTVNAEQSPDRPVAQKGSGLYRVRDTDGDDQFDEVARLKAMRGDGEHGLHALKLSPDGKSIFAMCGNHTDPPFQVDEIAKHSEYGSYLPTNWAEDLLLTRQWDANGHALGRVAPGGWVAQTDPDGKTWKMFSIGYRNAYDMDFNAEGELFTYDSDMEWDMGTPWYRPTRVVHATSGSELGWRSGTGCWPSYFVDSLPPVLDTGPGSPTGVSFGYGARLPAKYQRALFICDWTFGTIYAVHLAADGSSYKATKEEFLSRSPLPLTDLVVGRDGALYFLVGGRNTQSELYRVSYVGQESTAAALADQTSSDVHLDLRKLRRRIESYHGRPIPHTANPKRAIDEELWPALGHPDRFIRYAARVALEFQPIELWRDRLFVEQDAQTAITAAIAMAHQGEKSPQTKLLAALSGFDFHRLSEQQQLELLRAYQLAFIRMGRPDNATRKQCAEKFDAWFPAISDELNRELCNLLVYLESPSVVTKTIALLEQDRLSTKQDNNDIGPLLDRNKEYAEPIRAMLGNQPDCQKIHYALALRNVKDGWSVDERRRYFAFLRRASERNGGYSFKGFLQNIDQEAFDNASPAEQQLIQNAGIRPAFQTVELPKPIGPGREWTVAEVVTLTEQSLRQRDFSHGKTMYAAARCILCHRFAGEGGSAGPDLTLLAGRFTAKDLAEAMIEPSKVISDQYQASMIVANGKSYVGRIAGETKDTLMLLANPENANQVTNIHKPDIERRLVSKTSLMPNALLNTLNQDEVLDLMAYLLSRGNPNDPMFSETGRRPADIR